MIFFNKIYKNKIFQSFFSLEKCVKLHKRQKVFVFMDFIRETKDFKFQNLELGCHFRSEKVTCKRSQFLSFNQIEFTFLTSIVNSNK